MNASTGSTAELGSSWTEILLEDGTLRGMREGDIRSDGQIKKAVFMPRQNGMDRDGLSVSISDPKYLNLHRARYGQPGKATASIVVRDVREIGLDVVADPDDGDPRHALITGIPDRTLGDGEKLEAERIAQLLASRATVYTFLTGEPS